MVATVIRSISRSWRRLVSTGPVIADPDPVPSLANSAWNGTPYSAGEEMSRVRLAPNTAVAHSAATASTMPSSAVPTGTGCRPRPRSSAYRTPISALGGAPIQATARTSATGTGRRGGPPRSRASRTAGQADSATTIATVASTPASVTSGSMTTAPAELAASRASPTGVSGESAAASATAPAAPTMPMMAARARPSATNWPTRNPTADRARRSSASVTNCRAAACPMTASPASAARPASTHQPTACGLIARCTAAASISRSSGPSESSGRSWLSKAGRSASPCRSCT